MWEGLCSSYALFHRGLRSAHSIPKSHSPALVTFKLYMQHVVNALNTPWMPQTCCAPVVEVVFVWSGSSTCSEPIRFPAQCLFQELTASGTAAVPPCTVQFLSPYPLHLALTPACSQLGQTHCPA